MGMIRAALAAVRDAVLPPRPITLDLQPLQTFDTAPRPVDRVISDMKSSTSVTRDTALQVAAVQRGRNEICSISTLPLRLYRGLVAVDNALFRQFDPDVPNVVHLASTLEDLAFEGIAWWRVTARDFDGYPVAVRRVAPGRVTTTPPTSAAAQTPPGRYVWILRDTKTSGGDAYEQVAAGDMVRFDSPNPGILKANARAVRIAWKLDVLTELYAENPALREYFTDGDDPDVDGLTDDEIDAFLAEYGAMRNVRPFGWIPKSVKRSDVSSPSPKDLTLVELRQAVHLAIANGMGVDPEDLGVSTTSRTYQNAVDRKQDKINRVYSAYMSAITDRLGMGDVTRRGYDVRFDLTDYLKSDPNTQATYWKALKDMGVVDEQWIAEQAGIDPAVARRAAAAAPTAAASPAAAAGAGQNAGAAAGRFAGAAPAYTFQATEFDQDTPAPTVDQGARTITGLAVPYGAIANKYGIKIRFMPGSLEYSSPDRMPHLQDHATPVGFHRSITDTPAGPRVELSVADAPAGSPAKVARDQLLYDAAAGLYSGLSIGVDYSLNPDDGDVEIVQDDQHGTVYNVVRATWRETSTTYLPAFDDARVTQVAASQTGGAMHCQHCGGAHAANISCATFARQIAPPPAPPALPAGPAAAAGDAGQPAAGMEAFQQFVSLLAAQQAGAKPTDGPVVVNAAPGAVAEVTEPQPYRFDRRGNLGMGSHDFSSDLFAGWKKGDQAARDRVHAFMTEAFETGRVGRLDEPNPLNQFAITPANVVNLNYPANRPDLYVDQQDYQYPMYAALNKGTLDTVTPFVVPKFNSSSGLVADHVTGTEPTPGAFTATAQTITPSALSGKVEITREAFDQGGNPQMSGLIWRQMVRAWYEGIEAAIQAFLVAQAASIPDITLTTAAVDSALDQNLADNLIPLQYIRGGDRFRTVFTQIDLYKALVKAKDGNGRRLYPSIGAQNAVGTADPRYGWVEAHGKLWVPSWATAATGTVAASSWMVDPDAVGVWVSTPQRIDLEWRVAWIDMGIWGYKALALLDTTKTREIIYDPV